ncbi:MAG: hypothetical protein H0T51_08135 [Pirellulales bacterium]|nr:hypothetical protein [Pirellulales bacterium]
MNPNELRQPTVATDRKAFFKSPLGVLACALLGALIGFTLSKFLSLGERTQQLNLTNTGSIPMLVKIDTKRFTGDGEVLIEAGKVGRFIYGEGDTLSIYPGGKATGTAHNVTLSRKPILAEANADDEHAIAFAYKCE